MNKNNVKTKNLIAIIIIFFILSGCAMRRMYYPMFYNKKEADSTYSVNWEDDIRNPENAEFVEEVSFNEDIPFNQVTQEQFNKRYEIK